MSDTIYVRYTVQKSDTPSALWRAAEMTREDWSQANNGRDPNRILKIGEEIILKDPIQTCAVQAFHQRMSLVTSDPPFDFSFGRGREDACYGVKYGLFKPLRKFTKLLIKPADNTMLPLPPGKEIRTGGLEGVI